MPLPQADVELIEAQIQSIASRLAPANSGSNNRQLEALIDKILDSLHQLSQVIITSTGQKMPARDYTEVGDYAMQIVSHCSERMHDEDQKDIGLLAVSITLWMIDQGGEVTTLEPIVDTLAWLANQTQDHGELAELSDMIGKVLGACSLEITSDLENQDPGRPWRVLNINRGIVATRSHDPHVMDDAFQTLIKNLPQDAPAFFNEGMSEMEKLDYPNKVRKVMERYYEQWNEPHTIH